MKQKNGFFLKVFPWTRKSSFNNRTENFFKKVPYSETLKCLFKKTKKKSQGLDGCNFHQHGTIFCEWYQNISLNIRKQKYNQLHIPRNLFSHKVPPDTQIAKLTSKLEDFYKESQKKLVKSGKHAPESTP